METDTYGRLVFWRARPDPRNQGKSGLRDLPPGCLSSDALEVKGTVSRYQAGDYPVTPEHSGKRPIRSENRHETRAVAGSTAAASVIAAATSAALAVCTRASGLLSHSAVAIVTLVSLAVVTSADGISDCVENGCASPPYCIVPSYSLRATCDVALRRLGLAQVALSAPGSAIELLGTLLFGALAMWIIAHFMSLVSPLFKAYACLAVSLRGVDRKGPLMYKRFAALTAAVCIVPFAAALWGLRTRARRGNDVCRCAHPACSTFAASQVPGRRSHTAQAQARLIHSYHRSFTWLQQSWVGRLLVWSLRTRRDQNIPAVRGSSVAIADALSSIGQLSGIGAWWEPLHALSTLYHDVRVEGLEPALTALKDGDFGRLSTLLSSPTELEISGVYQYADVPTPFAERMTLPALTTPVTLTGPVNAATIRPRTRKRVAVVAYGSRGDVRPMRRIYEVLATCGVRSSWVSPISEDEGTRDLRALEQGDLFRSFSNIARVQKACDPLRANHRFFGSMPFPSGATDAIIYSLAPPLACAKPVITGIPIADIVSALVHGPEHMTRRSGATITDMPRICSNRTFFSRSRPYAQREPVGYAYGSSGAQAPAGGVVVPGGDHSEIMRGFMEVRTHGGAGTMTTAVSAGAAAKSDSHILDRRWYEDGWQFLDLGGRRVELLSSLWQQHPFDWFSEPYDDTEAGVAIAATAYFLVTFLATLPGMVSAWCHTVRVIASFLSNGLGKLIEILGGEGMDASNTRIYIAAVMALTSNSEYRTLTISRDVPAYEWKHNCVRWWLTAAVSDADLMSTPQNRRFGRAVISSCLSSFSCSSAAELRFVRINRFAPFWHVQYVSSGVAWGATEIDGITVSQNEDVIDSPDFILGLGGPLRSLEAAELGQIGLYGSRCNCITYILEALAAEVPLEERWLQTLVLVALGGYSSVPLLLCDIESREELSRFGPFAHEVARLFRAGGRRRRRAKGKIKTSTRAKAVHDDGETKIADVDRESKGDASEASDDDVVDAVERFIEELDVESKPAWVNSTLTPRQATSSAVRYLWHAPLSQRDWSFVKAFIKSGYCVVDGERTGHAACGLCRVLNRDGFRSRGKQGFRIYMAHLDYEDLALTPDIDAEAVYKGAGILYDSSIKVVRVTEEGEFVGEQTYNPSGAQASEILAVDDGANVTIRKKLHAPNRTTRHRAQPPTLRASPPLTSVRRFRGLALGLIDWAIGSSSRLLAWSAEASESLAEIVPLSPLPRVDEACRDDGERLKAAWGLQPSNPHRHLDPFFAKALSQAVRIVDAYGAELFTEWVNELNRYKPDGQPPLADERFVRFMRQRNPTPYTKARRARAMNELEAIAGSNCMEYATRENIFDSLSRYASEPGVFPALDEDALIETLERAVPGFLSDTHLRSPEFVARTLVLKYSAGVPFEGQLCRRTDGIETRMRRRRDLKRTGWLKAVSDCVTNELHDGRILPGIHHSFVKSYIMSTAKLEHDPSKVRTIVAQTPVAFIRDMVFNYELDKRMASSAGTAPWSIGITLSGAGYNEVAHKMVRRARQIVLDGKSLDANIPPNVMHVVAEIRAAGFRNHDEADAIRTWIHANYEALRRGAILDLHSGAVLPKRRGGGTGSSSVAANNELAVIVTTMQAWADLSGKDVRDFFEHNDLNDMGDDEWWATDTPRETMNEHDIVEAFARYGLPVRILSDTDRLEGVVWCKKQFLPHGSYADDFRNAGITSPRFVVKHDPASVATRQTAMMHKATPEYYYERTVGHMLLCAHNRALYEFLRRELDLLRPQLTTTKYGRYLLRAKKVPTYDDVIRINYRTPRARKMLSRPVDLAAEYRRWEDSTVWALRNTSSMLRALGVKALGTERLNVGSNDAFDPPRGLVAHAVRGLCPDASTRENFRTTVMQGPAASCIDVDRYWSRYATEYEKMSRDQAVTTFMTFEVLTLVAIRLHRVIGTLPYLKLPVALYDFANFSGIALYSAISGPYYASTGESSGFLSSFVPRDPWMFHKRVVCLAMDFLGELPKCPFFLQLAADFVAGAVRRASWIGNPLARIDDRASALRSRAASERWKNFMRDRVLGSVRRGPVVVSAPTGTGKSRELPGAALEHFRVCYLLVPRVILAESFTEYHRVMRGQGPSHVGVNVMTYGHFIARSNTQGFPDLSEDAIWMVDEAHDTCAELSLVLLKLRMASNVLLMTATPAMDNRVRILGHPTLLEAPFPAPHRIEKVAAYGQPMFGALMRFDRPNGRTLAIMPSLRDCERLKARCAAVGLDADTLHAGKRECHARVIIATQVVDAGMNIKGVKVVIDSGRMIVKDEGRLIERNVDESTATQRAGRTGRFGEGLAVALQPPSSRVVKVYPTTDEYTRSPAIWHDLYGIISDALPNRRNGYLYEVPKGRLSGLPPAYAEAILRFALRHDTPQDASEAILGLGVNDDAHADILPVGNRWRARILTSPRELEALLARAPFRVQTANGVIYTRWLRLERGRLHFNSARAPLVREPSVTGASVTIAGSVPGTYNLPSPASWMYGREPRSSREALRWIATHYLGEDDVAVKTTLRNTAARLPRDLPDAELARAQLEILAAVLNFSVYVAVGDKSAVRLNPEVGFNTYIAMVRFGIGTVQIAVWSSLTSVTTRAMRVRSLRGGSVSALSRKLETWAELDTAYVAVFARTLENASIEADPSILHLVDCGGDGNCGPLAILRGMDIDAPAPYIQESDAIRRWANREFDLRVNFIGRCGPDASYVDVDPYGGAFAMWLVLQEDHWVLGVIPRLCASTVPILPLRKVGICAQRRRLPYAYPATDPEDDPDWRTWYLADGHGELVAEPWRGMDWLFGRLDAAFGSDYPKEAALGARKALQDPRVKRLKGWCDYHRTRVDILYKGTEWFTLIPDLSQKAHAHAHFGRKIIVELGDDGGRQWRAAAVSEVGHACYNVVFDSLTRAAQIAGRVDVNDAGVTHASMPNPEGSSGMGTPPRNRKIPQWAFQHVVNMDRRVNTDANVRLWRRAGRCRGVVFDTENAPFFMGSDWARALSRYKRGMIYDAVRWLTVRESRVQHPVRVRQEWRLALGIR